MLLKFKTTEEEVVFLLENAKVWHIELLMSKIDYRIFCASYDANVSNAVLRKFAEENYQPSKATKENIVLWFVELFNLITQSMVL